MLLIIGFIFLSSCDYVAEGNRGIESDYDVGYRDGYNVGYGEGYDEGFQYATNFILDRIIVGELI